MKQLIPITKNIQQKMDIEDYYDHPPNTNLEYILENNPTITQKDPESFIDYVNSELIEHCTCLDNCQTCTNYKDFKISKTSDMVHECNSFCSCDPDKCLNRLVQKGPSQCLEIRKSPKINNQLGLYTSSFIGSGTFICEYAGEVISRREAEEREKQYPQDKNYIMCLNLKPYESGSKTVVENDKDMSPYQTFIDPTMKGNIGRYMNHSCEPNCNSVVVRVSSLIPKIGKILYLDFVLYNFEYFCSSICKPGY